MVVVVPAPSLEGSAWDWSRTRPIETLVIDRQPLFLAALASLLGAPPVSARVSTTDRADVGLEMVRRDRMDLVLCEVRAEPVSGIELVRVLAEEKPGIFTKDSGLDEFLVGVRAVLSGHRAIGAVLMSQLLTYLGQQPRSALRRNANHLSPTELEILAMIGNAQSIPTIAATRGISHKTVRNHLAKIYRKLELHGRTEAMLWAARMGLTNN
jgi:DNA-binding NarL/FixJ family response regulator